MRLCLVLVICVLDSNFAYCYISFAYFFGSIILELLVLRILLEGKRFSKNYDFKQTRVQKSLHTYMVKFEIMMVDSKDWLWITSKTLK